MAIKKRTGLLGALVFHLGLLVFVIVFGFATPLPLPGEEGILINFGTDETGFGDLEPMISDTPEEIIAPTPVEAQPEVESTEEIISQDFEEAPAIESEQETITEIEETIPVPEEVIQEEVEEVITPPEEKPREVDNRALYPGRSNTDETNSSEGISEGEGNQGSITGSPDSDNYTNALSTGQGGIDFSLDGRNPVSIPKPEYNAQVSGTIVVSIRVDRDGKVISAQPGVRGTNILDESLLEAARKAALKARFNSKSDAAFTQTGTITYTFILQ
jgi:colicin import membrane protein